MVQVPAEGKQAVQTSGFKRISEAVRTQNAANLRDTSIAPDARLLRQSGNFGVVGGISSVDGATKFRASLV
jgi:hypothetical protein